MLERIFPFLTGVNDLTNTHYPYRILVQREFMENHRWPFFNPLIFGGRSLLGDSLSDIFYPLFYLHVFLPFSLATIINLIIHFMISYVGVYLIALNILKVKKSTAIISGMIYILMPKIFYHITAGHLGMIESLAWLPLIFYFLLKVSAASYVFKKRDVFFFAAFCGMSALANYFIFYHIAVFLFLFWILEILIKRRLSTLIASIKFFCLTVIIFLLIAGVQIIPAILQLPHLIRESMSVKDILPLWSWRYLFQSIFFPFMNLRKFDQEAFLYAGILFYIVSFWGIWKARIKNKIIYLILLFLLINIVVNLKSPLFFLLQQMIPGGFSWRVTSRFWFFVQLILVIFFAKASDTFPKIFFWFICSLILIEYASIAVVRLTAPNPFGVQRDTQIYSFMQKKYHGKKVYTTSALLSQYYTALYGIELLAGESPWQDEAYVKKLKKAGGYAWFNEYTVIYPPIKATERKSPPVAELLCNLKGEVILSYYPLTDKKFKYTGEIDKIKVYENHCF